MNDVDYSIIAVRNDYRGNDDFSKIMKFFDTIRANFARFMSGRYGADTLGQHMIFGALAMTIIGSLTGLSFLSLMADALIVLALFRMLSKNRYKRAQENADYAQRTYKVTRAVTGVFKNDPSSAKTA